jgi:hypothetical protein
MRISDQLRDAADLVEEQETFICHALSMLNGIPLYQRGPAAFFLEELGMTLTGGAFMSRVDHTGRTVPGALSKDFIAWEEAKELRVAWCHFAADIYDEWYPNGEWSPE